MKPTHYLPLLLSLHALAFPIPQLDATSPPLNPTPLDLPANPLDPSDIEFIEVPPLFPDDPLTPPPSGDTPSDDPFTSDLDFGQCTDPTMIFLPGVNGRRANEFTFLPNNSDGFFDTQGEALDAATIASFICDNLVNSCVAGRDAVEACREAEEVVRRLGDVKDQSVADAFNAALGFSLSEEEELEEGEGPVEEGEVPVEEGELPVEEAPEEPEEVVVGVPVLGEEAVESAVSI